MTIKGDCVLTVLVSYTAPTVWAVSLLLPVTHPLTTQCYCMRIYLYTQTKGANEKLSMCVWVANSSIFLYIIVRALICIQIIPFMVSQCCIYYIPRVIIYSPGSYLGHVLYIISLLSNVNVHVHIFLWVQPMKVAKTGSQHCRPYIPGIGTHSFMVWSLPENSVLFLQTNCQSQSI